MGKKISSQPIVESHDDPASISDMSDKADWFINDGEREIGPLTEVELRKRLKKGDRDTMRVRQGENGHWYTADFVVKKFRELAKTGIYIKIGSVAGPYTAERAYLILKELTLDGILAKVGLHGEWAPATKLLRKLDRLINQDSSDSDDLGSPSDSDSDVGIEMNDTNEVQQAHVDTMPVVVPEVEDDVLVVQPVEPEIPTVQPVQPEPAPVPGTESQLVYRCTCGSDIRVLAEHVGMNMQCPVCGITFAT